MTAPANETVGARAAPALQAFVPRYRGYRYEGLSPGTHQGVPSGNLTFIVGLDAPTEITRMPGPQEPGTFHAFVGGLHHTPATIAHEGFGGGISIDVSPLASRAIFGVPAGELACSVVGLDDLLGRDAVELSDRVSSAASWPERFDVLDEILLRRVSEDHAPSPELRRTWDLLVRSSGQMPVTELASQVGWSRRHLSSRFRVEFGLAPKAAARVLRFEQACSLLDQGMAMADTAALAGYYDQAHLIHEWRDLAGVTPTAWQGDELRDHDADGVAFSARRVA